MASTRPTPTAHTDALSTVRLARLWPALVQRLAADAELRRVLMGRGRVHHVRDRLYQGDATETWARVVVVPVRRSFITRVADQRMTIPFLVRVDVCDPRRDDYDPLLTLDAAHARVFRLIRGWAPTVPGARVVLPVWRETDPDPEPIYDDTAGVLYTSAEYRCEAVPAPLT